MSTQVDKKRGGFREMTSEGALPSSSLPNAYHHIYQTLLFLLSHLAIQTIETRQWKVFSSFLTPKFL